MNALCGESPHKAIVQPLLTHCNLLPALVHHVSETDPAPDFTQKENLLYLAKKWLHPFKSSFLFFEHILPRRIYVFQHDLESLSNSVIRRIYRVSKSQFTKVITILKSKLQRTQRENCVVARSVSVPVMVFVTLQIQAGASYQEIGWLSRVASQTMYNVYHETIAAIDEMLTN